MLTLSEAQQRIGSLLTPLPGETVALGRALDRIAAEEVVSACDLPMFDNSAMDGFAVRALDLAQATPGRPVALRQTGRIAAGDTTAHSLGPGECARVYTGSALPPGADAVVMQEDTCADQAGPELILFQEPAVTGENIRRQGRDIRRGTRLVAPGQRLSIGRICLLAATGTVAVRVGRQPRVGLLATGSELQEAGQALVPGHIYECNRTALAALLPKSGAVASVFPLVPDTLEATTDALAAAFAECDVVLTSGGVSVGDLDWVKPAFERLGGRLQIWRVAVKPGKPFAFGQLNGKHLFGLPGNPASALVTYWLLVHPALVRLQGGLDLAAPGYPAILAEAVANPDDRPHFLRVSVDAAGQARSAGLQASHALSSLAEANGLLEVPPATTLAAGSRVQVLRWA